MFWGLKPNLNQSSIYYLLLFFVKSSLPFAALGLSIRDCWTTCGPASSHIGLGICHRWQISQFEVNA